MTVATPDKLSMLQLAKITAGTLHGHNAEFAALSIDSRTLNSGELFVALHGPSFDGHAFVDAAKERGAVALLVAHTVDSDLPQVVVADTHKALGELAAAWRLRYQLPLIAVTGSNGKTTVKEMLSSILSVMAAQQGSVLATHGNLNNDIGVPLTLMRLNSKHQYAVIEMGANHTGEIHYLAHLAQPTIALINNAGPAHLEGFGDVKGVAHAKGEIFEGLSTTGIAIFNGDDDYAHVWCDLCADRNYQTFGLSEKADVTASHLQLRDDASYRFRLHAANDVIDIQLPLPGRHNVMNALAASAAALAAGATLTVVRDGLQALGSVGGRLQVKQSIAGVTVIDDTYNANPASLQAALDTLDEYGTGEKILVLGDMGELGTLSASLHQQMGEQALNSGIDQLFTVGAQAQHAAQAFGAAAHYCATQEALIAALKMTVSTNKKKTVVLVKGSRSMQMERVVAALLETHQSQGGAGKDVVHSRAVGAGG